MAKQSGNRGRPVVYDTFLPVRMESTMMEDVDRTAAELSRSAGTAVDRSATVRYLLGLGVARHQKLVRDRGRQSSIRTAKRNQSPSAAAASGR